MHFLIDPVFTLQLLLAMFVVVTMSDEPTKTEATMAECAKHTPFQLSDGNTYVEHAGMTIEQELYFSLTNRGAEKS